MRDSNSLNALKVSKISEPGRYSDGHGLYLQVSEWGTKAWLFRFMLHGRARCMGLGALHTVSLAEARDEARRARQLLRNGIDPIEARKQQRDAARAEAAKRITFKEAAERYIKAHRAGWKSEKHAAQWEATLSAYAYPVIENLSVAAVETSHILQILEPIWAVKTETATRTRGRIELVLDWATARGYRRGDNPARWRGHLDKLLPARAKVAKVRHFEAMPFSDVPAFMADLRKLDSISARALELTILCATRTGETIGAEWSEFDVSERVWTIPGERTKSGREHRVPLSNAAVALLKALPRFTGSSVVFEGAKAGKPLSNMALLQLLRGMRGDGLTVHGFRSAFRDWCGEATNFPREVAEAALAHVLSDKTEAAYRRGDALEKRRKLMEAWAAYCDRGKLPGKVVPIKARAAM